MPPTAELRGDGWLPQSLGIRVVGGRVPAFREDIGRLRGLEWGWLVLDVLAVSWNVKWGFISKLRLSIRQDVDSAT